MGNIKAIAGGVAGFVADHGRRYFRKLNEGLPDGRGDSGIEREQAQFIAAAMGGKLADVLSLRGLEILTELADGRSGSMVGGGRLPDSTMGDWLKVTGEKTGYGLLVREASELHRSKVLMPDPSLLVGGKPSFLAVFDGKSSFNSFREEEVAPYFRVSYTVERKMSDGTTQKCTEYYWHVKIVRVVIATPFGPICIGLALAEGDNEQEAVRRLCQSIAEDCRWLRNSPVIVTGDSGQANKEFLLQQGDPYNEIEVKGSKLAGLGFFYAIKIKSNCSLLYDEAVRAAEAKMKRQPAPDAEDDWKDEGHGRLVKREAWLVQTARGRNRKEDTACLLHDYEEVANIDQKEWPSIRQFLVVKQTIKHKKPRKNGGPQVTAEYRVLAVNIKQEDVTPRTLLNILRKEWQVEVHHNILDLFMHEDDCIWAQRGLAPLILAAINSMATNMLVILKNRHLRSDFSRYNLSYPQLMFLIRHALLGGEFSRFQRGEKRATRCRRRPDDPELPPPVDASELPPEYTRVWSSEEIGLLLGSVRSLFKSLASLYADRGSKVTLYLTFDTVTKEVEHELLID